MKLTVDPVEIRGYEYHTGITFAFFAIGVSQELGRGGRYLAGLENSDTDWEPATGITFFLDSLIHAVPRRPAENSLFLPQGTPKAKAAELRADGWIAVMELDRAGGSAAEARRAGCTHILTDQGIQEIDREDGDET